MKNDLRDEILRHAKVILAKNNIANKYDAAADALAKSVLQMFSPSSDDAEPITWEWWYGITRDDTRLYVPGIPAVLIMEVGLLLVLLVWNGATQAHTPLSHIRTRIDLRRLWLALTGKKLDERKAGDA